MKYIQYTTTEQGINAVPQLQIHTITKDADLKINQGADIDHISDFYGVDPRLLYVWLIEYNSVLH